MYRIHSLLVSCLVLLLSCTVAGCAATAPVGGHGKATTLILVRHGERTLLSKQLNEKGLQRARDLVEAVGSLGITAIYSPDLDRNRDTVTPLASHLNIPITIVSNDQIPDVLGMILAAHPGETVLWVGNTDNLTAIYARLGGEGAAPVTYGDLYTATIPPVGRPSFVRSQFGIEIF